MKKRASALKSELEKVRRLCDKAQYDRAFAAVEQLLKQWPDNPHVLVMWANLLQLQEEDVGPSLEKARAALQRAVDLDEQAPMPLIELGQYLFALEDDAKGASKCFDKAIALCKRMLKEALLGKAKALTELERSSEAFACLAQGYWIQSLNGKSLNGPAGQEILEQLKELVPSDRAADD